MPAQTLRIAQLTDLHLFATPEQTLLNLRTAESLQMVLAAIRQLTPPPELLLLTGDISQDESPEAYELLQDLLCPLAIPTYWLPGNHDCLLVMQQVLKRSPFQAQTSTSVQGWQLLLLNSTIPGKVYGELSSSELQWLESELEANNKPTLVALHHPPFPIDSDWMDQIILHNAASLFEILDRYSQVKIVLFGHIHQEYELIRNSVYYLGTPSTCVQFLPKSTAFALDKTRPGFRLFDLHPNGSWDTQVIRIKVPHQQDLTLNGY
jgi:Icc protein